MIQLPYIQGDIFQVVRRLTEWADSLDLPRHDEPGVELVVEPYPPRPEWTREYVDPNCMPWWVDGDPSAESWSAP